jgi:hypothetical protein
VSDFLNHDGTDSLAQRERAGVREKTYADFIATGFLKTL